MTQCLTVMLMTMMINTVATTPRGPRRICPSVVLARPPSLAMDKLVPLCRRVKLQARSLAPVKFAQMV
jgi:hypothetical protein